MRGGVQKSCSQKPAPDLRIHGLRRPHETCHGERFDGVGSGLRGLRPFARPVS